MTKNLTTLLLTLLVLGGCASMSQNAREKISLCWEESNGEFWGRCYIDKTEDSFLLMRQIKTLNLESRWKLLDSRTKVLERKLNAGEINPSEANRQFQKHLNQYAQIADKRAREKAEADRLALQQLSSSLNQANCNLSGNPNSAACQQYRSSADYDWDWDAFYDQNYNLIWRCRGINTGRFADNSKCSMDAKDDDRWPSK